MLTAKEAADYCGIPAKRFPSLFPKPPVAMPHGHRLYDINDLDNWLDGLKNGQSDDADEAILKRLGT